MKTKRKTLRKRYNNYCLDHKVFGFVSRNGVGLIICLISAFLLGFGFRTFMAPEVVTGKELDVKFISSGVSGFSQNILLIVSIIFPGFNNDPGLYNIVQSVLYFSFNIPICILALKAIGVRFGIYTSINVILTSVFIWFLPKDFIDEISRLLMDGHGLERALFAGLCTGLSSAMAFKANQSAGGIDVISYYFATRKSTQVGQYNIIFNGLIMAIFAVLTIINNAVHPNGTTDILSSLAVTIILLFFSAIYLFISASVVDLINVRNKKVQVQIITSNKDLSDILLANFPHGATVVEGEGAYTKAKREIIYMVVSVNEVSQVIDVVREADPQSFVNVMSLQQVYGRFYIRPIK